MTTGLFMTNTCTCDADEECSADCWENQTAAVDEQVTAWLIDNPSRHGYLITGENMGWLHRSGDKHWDGRGPLWEQISIRGEWWQTYEFDRHEIHITQTHHDVPVPPGERYTVKKANAATKRSFADA